MKKFVELLSGGDLRSIGHSNQVVELINNQKDFDALFQCLFHKDRLIVMRTADAIEKLTLTNREYLDRHKDGIIGLCKSFSGKELKWHLALLVSRLNLSKVELAIIWNLLSGWALDKKESRIVRVNAIQALFDLVQNNKSLQKDFDSIISNPALENIPSIKARIKQLNNTSR